MGKKVGVLITWSTLPMWKSNVMAKQKSMIALKTVAMIMLCAMRVRTFLISSPGEY
jgi:hypothetical protein